MKRSALSCDSVDRFAFIEELDRSFSPGHTSHKRLIGFVSGMNWFFATQLIYGSKRVFDFGLAVLLLMFTFPFWAIAALLRLKPLFERTPRLGRWGKRFDEFSFSTTAGNTRFANKLLPARIPVLINILRGDMSFIGPRAATPDEMDLTERLVRRRYDVRPGLLCLWWLRQRTNIGYGGELSSDTDYIEQHGFWSDLGIALRAAPSVLYGGGGALAPEIISLLGVRIDNLTMEEAVEKILSAAAGEIPKQLCFVNADCINIAYRDGEYRRLLEKSDFVLADGIGMKLAGKLLRSEIRENVNGTDLFPRLCLALGNVSSGLYLLGGRPGVAEAVREWIAKHHPAVTVSGVQHGFFSQSEEAKVIAGIRSSGAKILLVAMGAPRQEKWLKEHLSDLGIPVAMGVGGLFDFYSGNIARAPQWLREAGLEWSFRFLQEPARMWKRYFVGNAIFLFRVIRSRWSGGPASAMPLDSGEL